MSKPSKITDHWLETVSDYILEQYRSAENWKAILKAIIDEYTDLEDEIWKLAYILDFKCREKSEIPSGALLDFVAGIVNVTRNVGESDQHFYDRFVLELSRNNAGTPDGTIYSTALLSGDPRPQYFDEADCTFFVYTGARPVEPNSETWEEGGRQLSRAQVRKMAPAGVLGLPGAAILDAEGNYITDAAGRLILAVADDSTIEREVLLADNNGAIVIAPNSVPVRVVLRGSSVPSIPTITTEWNGVPVDAVRIKDLPAAGDTNGYFVRDSDTEGTTSTRAMDEQTLDDLWNSTPAEGDE